MSKFSAAVMGIIAGLGLFVSAEQVVSSDTTQPVSHQVTSASIETFASSTHDQLVAKIKAKKQSGYLYDASPKNGGYRWYEKGNPYTGFRFYMGTYYWFVDGVRQNAGWRTAWGYTYWTDNSGRAVQGDYLVNGRAYNFGSNGTYYRRGGSNGYLNLGEGWRWYANGYKYTGFRSYMGAFYYFIDGWRKDNMWVAEWGNTYYVGNDGRSVQGWHNLGGSNYYFGDNGTFYKRQGPGVYVNGRGEGLIKGSQNGIYHVPRWYNSTTNVVQWFVTEQDARNAGYRPSRNG
ncbi:1,4-beta-N-acetylmuramidase [Weissella confusa]